MKCMLKSLGYRFKQQVIIPNTKSFYIVDFFIPDLKAVIEVDGEHHSYSPAQLGWDKQRTAYLESVGLKIIRVANRVLSEYEYPKTKKWLGRVLERMRLQQSKLG